MYVYIISNFRSYETNRKAHTTSYYAVGSDTVTKYRHILVYGKHLYTTHYKNSIS